MVNIPKKILLIIIKLYQKILSPDTGMVRIFYPFGACRYYPTCSQYGYQAINKHGLRKGIILTIKRVCRCHPLARGGYDPIPKN